MTQTSEYKSTLDQTRGREGGEGQSELSEAKKQMVLELEQAKGNIDKISFATITKALSAGLIRVKVEDESPEYKGETFWLPLIDDDFTTAAKRRQAIGHGYRMLDYEILAEPQTFLPENLIKECAEARVKKIAQEMKQGARANLSKHFAYDFALIPEHIPLNKNNYVDSSGNPIFSEGEYTTDPYHFEKVEFNTADKLKIFRQVLTSLKSQGFQFEPSFQFNASVSILDENGQRVTLPNLQSIDEIIGLLQAGKSVDVVDNQADRYVDYRAMLEKMYKADPEVKNSPEQTKNETQKQLAESFLAQAALDLASGQEVQIGNYLASASENGIDRGEATLYLFNLIIAQAGRDLNFNLYNSAKKEHIALSSRDILSVANLDVSSPNYAKAHEALQSLETNLKNRTLTIASIAPTRIEQKSAEVETATPQTLAQKFISDLSSRIAQGGEQKLSIGSYLNQFTDEAEKKQLSVEVFKQLKNVNLPAGYRIFVLNNSTKPSSILQFAKADKNWETSIRSGMFQILSVGTAAEQSVEPVEDKAEEEKVLTKEEKEAKMRDLAAEFLGKVSEVASTDKPLMMGEYLKRCRENGIDQGQASYYIFDMIVNAEPEDFVKNNYRDLVFNIYVKSTKKPISIYPEMIRIPTGDKQLDNSTRHNQGTSIISQNWMITSIGRVGAPQSPQPGSPDTILPPEPVEQTTPEPIENISDLNKETYDAVLSNLKLGIGVDIFRGGAFNLTEFITSTDQLDATVRIPGSRNNQGGVKTWVNQIDRQKLLRELLNSEIMNDKEVQVDGKKLTATSESLLSLIVSNRGSHPYMLVPRAEVPAPQNPIPVPQTPQTPQNLPTPQTPPVNPEPTNAPETDIALSEYVAFCNQADKLTIPNRKDPRNPIEVDFPIHSIPAENRNSGYGIYNASYNNYDNGFDYISNEFKISIPSINGESIIFDDLDILSNTSHSGDKTAAAYYNIPGTEHCILQIKIKVYSHGQSGERSGEPGVRLLVPQRFRNQIVNEASTILMQSLNTGRKGQKDYTYELKALIDRYSQNNPVAIIEKETPPQSPTPPDGSNPTAPENPQTLNQTKTPEQVKAVIKLAGAQFIETLKKMSPAEFASIKAMVEDVFQSSCDDHNTKIQDLSSRPSANNILAAVKEITDKHPTNFTECFRQMVYDMRYRYLGGINRDALATRIYRYYVLSKLTGETAKIVKDYLSNPNSQMDGYETSETGWSVNRVLNELQSRGLAQDLEQQLEKIFTEGIVVPDAKDLITEGVLEKEGIKVINKFALDVEPTQEIIEKAAQIYSEIQIDPKREKTWKRMLTGQNLIPTVRDLMTAPGNIQLFALYALTAPNLNEFTGSTQYAKYIQKLNTDEKNWRGQFKDYSPEKKYILKFLYKIQTDQPSLAGRFEEIRKLIPIVDKDLEKLIKEK